MKNLHLVSLDNRAHLIQPEEFDELTLTSSVSTIFTDFKQHKPLVLDEDTLAFDAMYLMEKAHVHLQLVVDKHNEMVGTVSYNELNEQQFIIKQKQGFDRYQLMVRDLMVAREDIKGLDYHLLDHVTIADLIDVLKREGMQHCLVMDSDKKQIRGIISARDISRRLHIPVEIEAPHTFVDIFEAVNDSHKYHKRQAI